MRWRDYKKKIGDGSKKFSELAYDEPKLLGLASAAVGQIPKVKAVDSNVYNTNEHRIRTAPLRNGAVYYKEGFACLIHITQGSN